LTSEPLTAHLATCRDGKPHVAPVWYDVQGDTVEIVTTGRKLANIRENPRVAASIEDEEWHAVLQGTASVVEDDERIEEVGQRLFEKYTGGAPADEYTDSDGTPQGTLIEISIGTATVRDN
jgi:PPOX class probable F420-dependent enzyme